MASNDYYLLGFCLFLSIVPEVLPVCTESNSTFINNHHPNKANNWEEQESWNSSRIDKFCPKAEYGILELACIDNKNETMGMNSNWVNTTRFSRLCDLNTGLICRPNKEHCPDYRIKYKCRCPKTSSTSMAVSSSSTAVAPTVYMSTALSGSISPTISTVEQSGQTDVSHTDVVGLPLAGIIGSVVGGLLLVALFCLLIIYCIKQKQKNKVLTMEGVEI